MFHVITALFASATNEGTTPQNAPLIFQPIVTDWLVPVILILVAAIGKKLSREGKGWKGEDFYIGPDLCLAAVSAGLLKIFDLLKHMPVPADKLYDFEYGVGMSALLIIGTFGGFVFVLSEHRELIGENATGQFRRTRLGLLCNGIGFGFLTAFIVLIKPV